MKTALSSFDLKALVAEWQGLVGGFVDKIYQRDDEVILRIRTPSRTKTELYFKAGRWLCAHEIEDKPEAPPPLAQTLRRLLDNARITAVHQRDFDRVAVFDVERTSESYRVIFELFGKGNIIVTKGEDTVACLFTQAFRDRVVRVGEPYAFPSQGFDPLDLDRDRLSRALRGAKGQVVRVLAGVMNLGGQYAEELCRIADVPKATIVRDLSDAQVDALYTALNNLAVAVDQGRRPAVILQEGRAIDAVPIELIQYADLDRRPFPTFNEALSNYLAAARPEEAEADARSERYARRLEQQETSLRELREEAGRLEAQALFLYGHYGPFDDLLRAVREGREPPEHGQIKAVDPKAHTVTIAIGDYDAITLDYERDVTGNAQALYDRRREAQRKAQRIEEALDATRREMEQARRKAERVAKKPLARRTKAMWFDAYRWTLSSDGHLILGGRDARSNDRLVKKHLKAGDRYAHADLRGAPSTVIKDGARAPEATLREACEFALAYSKAWSAGVASGSAYWVLPEQVSKRAESGEFLPRGAFVIRGKRNYLHDLPVRLAIGGVEVEGHRKIMGGPVASLASRSTTYVVVAPGPDDREAFAKGLAAAFAVPVEEVLRALPSGGLSIVEVHGLTFNRGAPPSS